MSNNLNELNTILFDTLRGVKSGDVDTKKAQTITSVSNAIINNAKTQLNAAKLMKSGAVVKTDFFETLQLEQTNEAIEDKSLYDRKLRFSKKLGYSNLAEAISALGSREFEMKFKEQNKAS